MRKICPQIKVNDEILHTITDIHKYRFSYELYQKYLSEDMNIFMNRKLNQNNDITSIDNLYYYYPKLQLSDSSLYDEDIAKFKSSLYSLANNHLQNISEILADVLTYEIFIVTDVEPKFYEIINQSSIRKELDILLRQRKTSPFTIYLKERIKYA